MLAVNLENVILEIRIDQNPSTCARIGICLDFIAKFKFVIFVPLLQKHNPHQFGTCLKRFSTIMAFHFNTPSQTPLRKLFSPEAQNFCSVEIFPWGTLFRTLKNTHFPVLSVRIGLLRKNPNQLPKPLYKNRSARKCLS